jgi:hypothetical protein
MQITIQHTDDNHSTPVWITYLTKNDCRELNVGEGLSERNGDTLYTPGYYWAVCSPGCIPDSEFYGPFSDETAADSAADEHLNW